MCSLAPGDVSGNWMKAKALRVEAALRINNGGTSAIGPGVGTRETDLYPVDWAHLDSLKASFDPYVYWRW